PAPGKSPADASARAPSVRDRDTHRLEGEFGHSRIPADFPTDAPIPGRRRSGAVGEVDGTTSSARGFPLIDKPPAKPVPHGESPTASQTSPPAVFLSSNRTAS